MFHRIFVAEKQNQKEECTILCYGMLFGILLGGIALATIVTLYAQGRQETKKPTSREVVIRWNATGTIVAGLGSGGITRNPVVGPFGFTFDDANRIYIAEYLGNRVSRWIPRARNGTIVAGSVAQTPSSSSSGFYCPSDVLLESNGGMYITDTMNNRLQFWPNGASSAATVAGFGSNTSINLNNPYLMTRDPKTKEIYITSTMSHTVVAYPSGLVVGKTNSPGNTPDRLNDPEGVVFDSFTNSLIISNGWGQSIVRWSLGSANWTLIAGVPGVAGNDAVHLNRPEGLTLDPMGNVYVADYNNRRIQLFMNGLGQGVTVAGAGLNGTMVGRVAAVKLDNQLNLYVADYDRNCIVMFARYG